MRDETIAQMYNKRPTFMGQRVVSHDLLTHTYRLADGSRVSEETMRNARAGQVTFVTWDESPEFNPPDPRVCAICNQPFKDCEHGQADQPYRCPFCQEEQCTCHDTDSGEGAVVDETPIQIVEESQQDDSAFDRLVASASVPNLATLFRQGIKAGVLEAHPLYN